MPSVVFPLLPALMGSSARTAQPVRVYVADNAVNLLARTLATTRQSRLSTPAWR